MFGDLHPRGERLWAVAGQHRDCGLADDRTVVERLGDEVDRAAGVAVRVRQRLCMGVEAAVVRQQRGVDVEHPAVPLRDESGGQDAHVTRQCDELRVRFAQFRIDPRIVRLARHALVRERESGDPLGLGEPQSRRVRIVAHDEHDLVGTSRGAAGIDQRRHVGPTPRNHRRDPRAPPAHRRHPRGGRVPGHSVRLANVRIPSLVPRRTVLCAVRSAGNTLMRPPFMPPAEDFAYLRRLAYTIVILLALVVVWRASDLLMLAFGSVLGAVVFRSAMALLQRIGLTNRHLALAAGILLVLVLFGLTAWLLTAQFGEQLAVLLTNLPEALDKVAASLSRTPVGEALVAAARAAAGGSTFANLLGKLSIGAGEILVNFIIVVVGAVFIAVDPGVYRRGVLLLTPASARPQVDSALRAMGEALGLWLNAQLICMTTMGLLVAFGLWVTGLKSWGALGLLAGLSEFVPYVGPTLAMLPALALASAQGGNQVLFVALVYIAVRMVQTNFITPFVTRRVVAIPPALTLFVILGTGAVFGVYGLFFSAALLVVFFVGVRELYLRDTLGETQIEAIPRRD